MLKYVRIKSPSVSFDYLYVIDNIFSEFMNDCDHSRLITTNEVSTEIRQRMKANDQPLSAIALSKIINHAFNYLVKERILNEIPLN